MLTLAIIKPDALAAGKAGKVLAHLEAQGFTVRACRMLTLTGYLLNPDESRPTFIVGLGAEF